jgi:hypothetical protein
MPTFKTGKTKLSVELRCRRQPVQVPRMESDLLTAVDEAEPDTSLSSTAGVGLG